MEKKKMKLRKKILIVFGIILAIFAIHTVRNMVILRVLSSRASAYENANNFYVKSTLHQGEDQTITENYKKDNRYILRLENVSSTGIRRMTRYFNGETSNTYIESETEEGISKVVYLDSNNLPTGGQITNWLYTENVGEYLLMSAISSVRSEKLNGKSCYKISNFYTTQMLVSTEGKFELYIEKETGLLLRNINGITTDENGKAIPMVVDYEYKFDVVTDEDLIEPDVSEYEIQENEENQASTSPKIEGIYYDEYGYATDSPCYIFDNGKVSYAGNDGYTGTYEIEGDKIKIQYDEYYPPAGEETVKVNEKEVLRIIDEETLIREETSFEEVDDFSVHYSKNLKDTVGQPIYDNNGKMSLVCPEGWKIVMPDIDGGEIHLETEDSNIQKHVGVNINSYENWDNETLEEHFNKIAGDYDSYENIKIIGEDGILRVNKSGIEYGECQAIAFFMKDGWTYEIGFYSNKEELFDKYFEEYERILQEIELW